MSWRRRYRPTPFADTGHNAGPVTVASVPTPFNASDDGVDRTDDDRARATERSGVRVAVAAYLIWGLLTVYWKQLDAFDAFELIGWRMLTAGIVMAVIVTVRGSSAKIISTMRVPDALRQLAVAALLLTINWGSYVWAVVNDRVIETALGYFIAPLVTMTIGVTVLGERPDVSQKIAFASALVAVTILTVSYGRPPWIALVLAATWSLYALAKRRITLDAIDSLAGETFVLFIPAVVIVVLASLRSASVVQSADAGQWGFALGTGLITAIPLMLFASAAKSIPFTLLGPLNLLVPVINFGLGWMVYGEDMPAVRLLGFAFVWLALIVVMAGRFASTRPQGAKLGK